MGNEPETIAKVGPTDASCPGSKLLRGINAKLPPSTARPRIIFTVQT